MSRDFEATSSSTSGSIDYILPPEEHIVVVPTVRAGFQKLSSSLVGALYLGVHSAFGAASRLNVPSSLSWVERAENATDATVASEVACEESVLEALNSQKPEDLSDGMTPRLGVKIATCLQTFGDASLVNIAAAALRGTADPDALSHALRWIGRLRDQETFHGRLLLLTRTLEAPSAIVRDGAGLGLVELGSRAALPALTAAIDKEANNSLREDLEQVAAYLRSR